MSNKQEKMAKFVVLEDIVVGVEPKKKGDIVHLPEGTDWPGKLTLYVESAPVELDAHAAALAERDARITELEGQVAAKDVEVKSALEAAGAAQGPEGAETLHALNAKALSLEADLGEHKAELTRVQAALDEANAKLAAVPAPKAPKNTTK